MYRLFCFLILMAITPINHTFAQDDDFWDDDWNDYDHFWWNDNSNPFLEFNLGEGELKHKMYPGEFTQPGVLELKIGFSDYDKLSPGWLSELEESYFFISHASTDINSEELKANQTNAKLWRFGFGNRSAYAYDVKGVMIAPFSQGALVWSRARFDNIDSHMPEQVEILERYHDAFRFGTLTEGGLKLEYAGVGLSFSYDASVIFPRYLVWKHLGSFAIEGIGLHFIDEFVEEVMESSPAAAPIVSFLLKNGYNFAWYALKRDDMNWPFSTETPLTMETIRFGVSFTF